VYRNTGSGLTTAWTSPESDETYSVAWGDFDGDGDLDLAAANWGQPNRVYVNTGVTLAPAWASAEADTTIVVAWGDVDGDGDLDLAAGNWDWPNRVYENGFLSLPGGLPDTPTSPVLADRPGGTAAAPFGCSSAGYVRSPVTIPFTLFDEQSDPAWRIVPEYSLTGGGQWLPATGVASPTTNLSTDPWGAPHDFVWDAAADGVTHEPHVAFRISVLWQAPDRVGGPVQRGAMAAVSPPFMAGDPVLFADGFESGDTTAWSGP
ncbi:MAG: FG-GAP-like repeat-containing protein, partial [Holophagae bacterium]